MGKTGNLFRRISISSAPQSRGKVLQIVSTTQPKDKSTSAASFILQAWGPEEDGNETAGLEAPK